MNTGKTFESASITTGCCVKLCDNAIAKATELNMKIAICIVDQAGVLKHFVRMDHAPLIAIDASRKKAVTAVGFGMPTGEAWQQFIKDDPILNNGVGSIHDFTLLGGGSPITINGQIVGAIGVSGGHYAQDEECVRAALDTID
jgi:uncharacterized protein GlcG (DUF336 family)